MAVHNEQAGLMTCMEVLGGNESVDQKNTMMGLTARIYAKPFGNSIHGGDVYYLSSCATGRIIRLLIADVSGHGEGVNEPAEKLRWLMRRYINQIDQKSFVKAMNAALLDFSTHGLFATAIVATYFAPTRTLTITNAGHPRALYYNSINSTWEFLQKNTPKKPLKNKPIPTNIPLGILAISDYETHEKCIKPDDIILCYTDALSESKTANGDILTNQELLELVNQLNITDHQQIIPQLIAAIQQLNANNLNDDDVTFLMFTPNYLFEQYYQTPNIKKYWLIMTTMLAKIFNKDQPFPWPDLHPANLGGAMFSFMNKLWGRHLK